MRQLDAYTKPFAPYADIFIRLSIGFHLIYGSQDNIFSWNRMLEFESYLSQNGFPYPLFGAILSVYCQFIAGILFIIGFNVKIAALVMILNFLFALFIAHVGDGYQDKFPALMMLSGSLFLLFNGSGSFSIEKLLKKNKK